MTDAPTPVGQPISDVEALVIAVAQQKKVIEDLQKRVAALEAKSP